MRRTLTSITLLLGVAAWKTLGDAVGDFTNLQQQCLSVSNDLLNSVTTVNNTSGQAGVTITTQYNTAGALGGIAQSLATSQTSYQNNQVRSRPLAVNVHGSAMLILAIKVAFVNGQPQAVIDNAFLDVSCDVTDRMNIQRRNAGTGNATADAPIRQFSGRGDAKMFEWLTRPTVRQRNPHTIQRTHYAWTSTSYRSRRACVGPDQCTSPSSSCQFHFELSWLPRLQCVYIPANILALQDYARGLTARTIISPSATIRSITAENSLDDAEVCWGRGAAASM